MFGLTRIHWILATGAVLSLFLLGGIMSRVVAVAGGDEIVMSVEGYDPRDFLAGHFVQVRLMPATGPAPAAEVKSGADVWVRLSPAAEGWRVAAISVERPAAQPGERLVRAKKRDGFGEGPEISLDYGVERIYQPQATAVRIEKLLQARNSKEPVALILSVQGDGRLLPKAVLVGKTRVELATLT